MLTQKRLKEIFFYDPKDGLFTRKIQTTNSVQVGAIAGKNSKGYVQICIDGEYYLAHRLAWLFVNGYFPEHDIDHRDRTKRHNWIGNLREVSPQCNIRNTGNFKHNSSGVKGISWRKQIDKWRAYIKINQRYINLGCYTEKIEAVCVRLAAEQAENWEGCDSSSPAFQYVQNYLNNNEL